MSRWLMWYTTPMLKSTSGSLVIASIILCDVACWLVVTGGNLAWLVALAAIVAFVGSMAFRLREFGEINDQIGDGCEAFAMLFLSIPVVMLLPLVHIGRYSRFGGWLTLAVDGSLALFFAFATGSVQAAFAAGVARIRGPAPTAGCVPKPQPVDVTRDVVVRALSARHEDEAAARMATTGDAELRTICERAAWYRENPPIPPRHGGTIPIETALALAAVEVLEGAPRSLRRTRGPQA